MGHRPLWSVISDHSPHLAHHPGEVLGIKARREGGGSSPSWPDALLGLQKLWTVLSTEQQDLPPGLPLQIWPVTLSKTRAVPRAKPKSGKVSRPLGTEHFTVQPGKEKKRYREGAIYHLRTNSRSGLLGNWQITCFHGQSGITTTLTEKEFQSRNPKRHPLQWERIHQDKVKDRLTKTWDRPWAFCYCS